jgi:hypothetical protein
MLWFHLKTLIMSINTSGINAPGMGESFHWGSVGLSCNPSITPDFVERNLDQEWDWGFLGLSMNTSMTFNFIEKHNDKPWHWGLNGISNNPFE